MIRAQGAGQAVFGERLLVRLQVLLQRRLVIASREAMLAHFGQERLELAGNECARLFHAPVDVDGGNERLVAVRQERSAYAGRRSLFAPAEQQMIA